MEITDQQSVKATAFVSYAREDRDFVQVLRSNLAQRGIDPVGDWLLTTGEDYANRLRELNLGAHALLFVISPDSMKSDACKTELALAVEHKKQILPISRRDHGDDNLLDSALRAPQWTFLREGDDFEQGMEGLVKAVNTDFGLMDMHGRLLVAADEWVNNGRNRSYLLRKDGLTTAESWLATTSGQPNKLPQPTPLEIEFIFASQRARSRGTRIAFGIAIGIVVALAALSIVALGQRSNALKSAAEATRQATIAKNNATEAQRQQTIAQANEHQAKLNADEAKRQQTEAELQKKTAEDNAREAQRQRQHAEDNAAEARRQQAEAERQTEVANTRLASIYWNNGIKAREQSQPMLAAQQFMRAAEGFAQVKDPTSSRHAQLAGEYLAGDFELQDIVEMKGAIRGVSFNKDESSLLVWSYDEFDNVKGKSYVGIWDRQNRKFRFEPNEVAERIDGCQLTSDTDRILCWSRERTAYLWSGKTGQTLFAPLHQGSDEWTEAIKGGRFSHDETKFVTWTGDWTTANRVVGSARIWDAKTGVPVTEPLMHEKTVRGAAFTHDDSRLLTWSDDGSLRIWSVANGSLLAKIKLDARIQGVTLSPDESRLVTWGGSQRAGMARVWDTKTGEPLSPALTHSEEINGVSFDSNGSRFVTWSGEKISNSPGQGSARVWDAATGKPLTPHLKHEGDVRGAWFSADGKYLFSWGRDRAIRAWYISEKNEAMAFAQPAMHSADIVDAQSTPDGNSILSITRDGAIHFWDALSGNLVSEHILNQQDIYRGQLNADQRTLVTWKDDGVARVWRQRPERDFVVTLRHPQLSGVKLNQDGGTLATWSDEGMIRFWDSRTGREIPITKQTNQSELWRNRDVVFSPDKHHALVLGQINVEGYGYVLDLETGARIGAKLEHADAIVGAAFSSDGRFILTWSDDKTARVWNSSTGLPVTPSLRHESTVRRGTFGDDAKLVLTYDGSIRAWDAATGHERPVPSNIAWKAVGGDYQEWAIHGTRSAQWSGQEITLADDAGTHRVIRREPIGVWGKAIFSPDGSRALVLSSNGVLEAGAEIWDSSTGKVLVKFAGHKFRIQGGTFTLDGKKVLTWGEDGTARLWDAATGREVIPPLTQKETVWAAGFNQDESRIITSTGRSLRVWNALTGEPLTTNIKTEGQGKLTPDNTRILTLGFRGAELRDGKTGQLILPTLRLRWPNGDPYKESGNQIASEDGTRVVDWNFAGRVRIWNLWTSYDWPRDQLRLRLEALTGTRLNSLDEIEVLPRKEWDDIRAAYLNLLRGSR